MTTENIISETALPAVMELAIMEPNHFISFFLENKIEIDNRLLKCGAIKFKGVHIDTLKDFQQIVSSISNRFLRYVDGNSPRTKLSENVYTSTEYDQTQKITMHNELSYSGKWPNKLFFSCLIPSVTGGETLLVDSREILKKMNKDIVTEIQQRGIMYIRNLHGGGLGMGPSWQDTFETDDKRRVTEYCKSYAINFEWGEEHNLKLIQKSAGIIEHRQTREKVWFNQIDQFHPSHLGHEIYDTLKAIYNSPEDFPMYVKFGDGNIISEDMVNEIITTIDNITIAPLWKENELLLIDNELVGHGRNSFTGERKVLVAMSE